MSKIICDVCGTSYAETATQCPICGCVRPSDVTVVAGTTNEQESGEVSTYAHIKGGRFSKSNVRKRNQTVQSDEGEEVVPSEAPAKSKRNTDMGLVIAVSVLLLAIVVAVIYIALHFFNQEPVPQQYPSEWNQTTASTTAGSTETTLLEIPCTDILVSKTSVTLNAVGETCNLVVTQNPTNTTDVLQFATSDDLVAKVSGDGVIEAIGDGEAVITITCGTATAECKVICKITPEETTENTEPTTSGEPDGTTEQTGAYKISHSDVTLRLSGAEHEKSFRLTLKDSNGNAKDVKWIVGDPSVCAVSGNTVTAIKAGYTKVKVTVDDVTYVCIVRVV